MKYRLVVFDLDGTLVNSLKDLAISVNFALNRVGLPTHEIERYKTFVGNGREKLVERAMGEVYRNADLREIVKKCFDEYYGEHCSDNTEVYPGCEKMLADLACAGVKTAVLSNKPDEFIGKILKRLFPSHKFDIAWGKKPGYKTKPDPQALNEIIKTLGAEKNECLYIGDSDVDIYTAENAGVDILGVDWGFRGRAELISAGAAAVVSSASQITEYINEN